MSGEADKLKILLALIFILTGMSFGLLSHPIVGHGQPIMRVFGILLMIFGIIYLYFKFKMGKKEKEQEQIEEPERKRKITRAEKIQIQKLKSKGLRRADVKEPEVEDRSILARFMDWSFTKSEGISQYTLPIIGAVIIDAVLIYNILSRNSLDLRGFDTITITFGISLIVYNYIPDEYNFARNFFVFFFGLLFFILVFPPIFYKSIIGTSGNAVITKALLGDPVVWLLNLSGIKSTSTIVGSGSSEFATIYFPLAQNGLEASVQIGESCSGIYTVSIFLSAFITFVLLEYKRFDLKVGSLIVLGIFISYIGNIIRMYIIVLVGHYYDSDPGNMTNLGWTHSYAGLFIFLAWIIPFWFLMYWFLMRKDINKDKEKIKS
jgi:exosortase/archaeosortase family protein